MPATVYLIHFDSPYYHARHYIGYTTDLARRLDDHRSGNGARLIEVITNAGITWRLARTWPDAGRDFERHLKRTYKNAPKLCPLCRAGEGSHAT